jgi:hypothetical protein
MKLFMVSGITIRRGDPHSLIVAESAEKAEEIFLKKNEEDHYIMSTYAREITEIDGYKIVFHKGKRITLTK